MNYDFSGVDKTGKIMGLRYAEFVVPLTKAVQELSKMNDEKDEKIDNLEKQNNNLEQRVAKLEALMQMQSTMNEKQETINVSFAALGQNIPNPSEPYLASNKKKSPCYSVSAAPDGACSKSAYATCPCPPSNCSLLW